MEASYRLYSSQTEWEPRKTWAEIDLGALRHNYRLLRDMLHTHAPATALIAVVKAEP